MQTKPEQTFNYFEQLSEKIFSKIQEAFDIEFKDEELAKGLIRVLLQVTPRNVEHINTVRKMAGIGDVALNLAIQEKLMILFPRDSYGAITQKKDSLVSDENLKKLYNQLSFGFPHPIGSTRKKIFSEKEDKHDASLFEFVLGLVHLINGFDDFKKVVQKTIIQSADSVLKIRDEFVRSRGIQTNL